MAEDDPKVDVEVSVQDSASGVLKQIVKEIDIVTRKMVEAGVKGSEAFDKIRRGGRGGKDEMDRSNKSLSSMSEIMGNMGKAMLGPAGLAAGLYAVGQALHTFATQRVQLQAMTNDIGFTAEKISQVKRIIGSMTGDFSGARAESFLTNVGGALKELQTLDVNSPLFSMLTAWNETDFANELLDVVKSGDIDKALDMIIAKFEEMSRRNPARAHLFATELLKVQPSILMGWTKAAKDIELVQKKSLQESEAYLKNIEKAHNVLNTAMGKTFDTIFAGIVKTNAAYEYIAPIASKYLGGTHAGYLATEKSPDITDENERIRQNLPPLTQGPTARQHGGPAYSGRPYMVGEAGPELFVPSQSGQVVASASASPVMRELVEQERESNKALDDILTALTQMEGMGGGRFGPMGFGGATGGGASTGGGGGGTSTGAIGALGGQVHGFAVDPYAGQTGQKLFDPMSGTLGGGLGGHSAMFGPGHHMGLDIMGKMGSSVHAIKDGVIVRAPKPGQGHDQVLIIKHQDGTYTRYLHQMYKQGVEPGQFYKGGSVVGASGHRNADHSHVEFWVGEPGARGSKLGNLRAIMGYDKNNLPVGGQERVGRGPSTGPTYAGQDAGVPGAALTPGRGGEVAPAAVNRRLMELIQGSGLVGYLPPDAAKYGMKTGSAAEWAALMTSIAGKESSYNTSRVGDVGQFGGHGSRGLFQLSPQDAITYGIRDTPFTYAELHDPEFNARMAVKIAAIRARKGGIGGPEGMAKYWRGPITSGGVSAKVTSNVTPPPQGAPTVAPSPVGAKQTAATGALTPSQQFIAAKTKEEADAAMARSRTDWSRDMVNQGLASDGSLLRTGKVSAQVDFGEMWKNRVESQPFMKLKQGIEPQGNPVHASQQVPGDAGYGQWVP